MMGPWTISGSLLLGAALVLYEGAPDYPGPGPAVALVDAPSGDPLRAAARRWSARCSSTARTRSAATTCRRCASSARPASPGTPTRGGGTSARRRRPAADRELHGRHRGQRRDPRQRPRSGPSGRRRSTARASGWRPTSSTATGAAPRRRRRARDPGAVARDDARVLGRPTTKRYLDAYWRAIPDLWIHGDWAGSTPMALVPPRPCDDTLKVAGKRVGPAEVEAAAVAHPAVVEAAAIGVPDELKGEVVVVWRAPSRATTDAGPARRDRRLRGPPTWARRCGRRPSCRGRAAEDAERQDHAPRRAGGVPGH